ncbi:MAG: TRAP transporter small permease [Alphaproteobacteria bacterium]|nr:TRAP transporter small permease [Alphaproteobacteria bacterium]
MRSFVRTVDTIAIVCAVLAAALVTAAVLVVTWMVLWRALGNSAYWEIEFAVYATVAAIFLGSPYCARTNGHVGVDLLSEYLPPRAKLAMAMAVAVLSLIVCLYLTVEGAGLALKAWHTGETTESLWRPAKWPFYATMPLGLGLTALQYVAELLRPRADAEGA